jgi:RNA polymerase sigma factor (sigma-70 family)
MDAASVGARIAAPGSSPSRRLLSLAADERLVEQIRRGNEAAFGVVFDRYSPPLLAFCRHMLGSREEAEDAVQLTFAAAHSDLLRQPGRAVALKPWLFTIARNRCLSMLRARRERPAELADQPSERLDEQVEGRAELRQLLADVRELPQEQRAALLLAEVSDLSHAQVAEVLGCEVARVKALVFRARTALIDRRTAREARCVEIQEQLANLRGGSLRRTPVRLHLRECAACRTYQEEVRNQRRMLAAALPVTPSLALKSSVMAGLGVGGGSAGGGIAAGVSSLGAAFGGSALAKVALVAVVAGGGAIAVPAVVDSRREAPVAEPQAVTPRSEDTASGRDTAAGTSAAIVQPKPARGLDPAPTARGRADRPAQAEGRSPSPGDAVQGKRTKHDWAGPVPPGQANAPPGQAKKADGKATPPGQAKKGEETAIPPGQARRPEAKNVPPGQAKRTESPPGGAGKAGNKGTNPNPNSGKAEVPSPAPPKVKDKPPTAAPVTEPVPAAPSVDKPKDDAQP